MLVTINSIFRKSIRISDSALFRIVSNFIYFTNSQTYQNQGIKYFLQCCICDFNKIHHLKMIHNEFYQRFRADCNFGGIRTRESVMLQVTYCSTFLCDFIDILPHELLHLLYDIY